MAASSYTMDFTVRPPVRRRTSEPLGINPPGPGAGARNSHRRPADTRYPYDLPRGFDHRPPDPLAARDFRVLHATHHQSPAGAPEGTNPIPRTPGPDSVFPFRQRSEEHTSELQSLAYLVCRLL